MTTKRVKLRDNEEPLEQSGGSYFAAPKTKIDFIGSGAALLDCVVGGGWPLGRVSNIVGDKSTSANTQPANSASVPVSKPQ